MYQSSRPHSISPSSRVALLPPVAVSSASLAKKERTGEYKRVGESWLQIVASVSHATVLFAPSTSVLVKYRLGAISASGNMQQHPFMTDRYVLQVRDHSISMLKISSGGDAATTRPRTMVGDPLRRGQPSSTMSHADIRTPSVASGAPHANTHARGDQHGLVKFRLKAAPSLMHAEASASLLYEQAVATLSASTVQKRMSGEYCKSSMSFVML